MYVCVKVRARTTFRYFQTRPYHGGNGKDAEQIGNITYQKHISLYKPRKKNLKRKEFQDEEFFLRKKSRNVFESGLRWPSSKYSTPRLFSFSSSVFLKEKQFPLQIHFYT